VVAASKNSASSEIATESEAISRYKAPLGREASDRILHLRTSVAGFIEASLCFIQDAFEVF
jgi:hypothetical protein